MGLVWAALTSADPEQPRSWPCWARLLAHVMVAAEHAQGAQVALESTAGLLNNAGIYLAERAELAVARDALQQALAIREAVYGPDHLQVARILSTLGIVLAEFGELTTAKQALERALAIYETAYGPNHPNVCMTLANLFNVYVLLGESAAAWQALERALAMYQTYWADPPEVAIDVTNAGTLLHELENPEATKAFYEHALAINKAVYGPDHPDVAIILCGLGIVSRDLGDLAGARRALKRALLIFDAMLGSDHPHTRRAARWLADL
ncbi:MAG: tetratricopeptide repeat protein [Egibacteraceae bacterium]